CPLQRTQHDVQPHTQADGEAALMHLEFRGVVWTWRTARGDTHTEVAAWPLLQEQAHIVTGHDDVAVLDYLTVQFIQSTLLDKGRLCVMIHHCRATPALEGEMGIGLVGLCNTTHKGAQALDDLLPYSLVEGAQRATHHGCGRDDVMLRAGEDLPNGEDG